MPAEVVAGGGGEREPLALGLFGGLVTATASRMTMGVLSAVAADGGRGDGGDAGSVTTEASALRAELELAACALASAAAGNGPALA
jgi:hypothetical protein